MGDPGRDVQDSVAERVDLAAGQRRVVVESDELGPGNQVGGDQHGLEPGGVLGLRPAGYLESFAWCPRRA